MYWQYISIIKDKKVGILYSRKKWNKKINKIAIENITAQIIIMLLFLRRWTFCSI